MPRSVGFRELNLLAVLCAIQGAAGYGTISMAGKLKTHRVLLRGRRNYWELMRSLVGTALRFYRLEQLKMSVFSQRLQKLNQT